VTSKETTASTLINSRKLWQAGTIYKQASQVQDSNGNQQIAYYGSNSTGTGGGAAASGSAQPVWQKGGSTLLSKFTCDGGGTLNPAGSGNGDPCTTGSINEIAWSYQGSGVFGMMTTPQSANQNEITVSLAIQDGGPETGWKLYASTDGTNFYLQTQCGTQGVLSGSQSCVLTRITTGTAKPPTTNAVSLAPPAWAGFPSTW